MKCLKTRLKRLLAASVFCVALSIGTTALADEGTVKVASAKIRASADTNSEQLGSVAQGGKVDIIGETTGTDGKIWYQVFVNANEKGYIRADLVNRSGNNSTTNTTLEPESTTASSVDAKKGTVITSNVRIRKGASTEHGVVATANRGMVVTVTGEANGSDGKKWYQISFTYNDKEITGFIRSDLVTFDNVPADTAVSEITGTEEAPEAIQTEEQIQNTDTEQEQTTSSNNSQNIILMNVEEVPYIMPGFTAVNLKWNEQDINAYSNGKFYIFYAQQQNGEEGWYVFDSEKGVYQRYVYTTADAQIPEEKGASGNMLIVIALVIVIVILIAIIALMFLKLREYNGGYVEFDEDEDSEDEDLEDLEELEEIADEQEAYNIPDLQKPAQRSGVRPAPSHQAMQGRPQMNMNGQPIRRPMNRPDIERHQEMPGQMRRPPMNGVQGMNGQPVRRPQSPIEGDGIVRRRPENENGMGNRPQGARPMPNGQMPVRRPNPNGQPMQQRPQNMPTQGHRAKNFLETEDDDMDMIDI